MELLRMAATLRCEVSSDFVIPTALFPAEGNAVPDALMNVEVEDFHWLGSELHKLGVPMFSLPEGGYSQDLPELILAYLKGISGQ